MRAALLCSVLLTGMRILAASVNPEPATWPVTVIVDFEGEHSNITLDAMRHELREVLAPVGVQVELKLKSEIPEHAEFHDLVVFKMKGHCTMESWPVAALSDERGALAMTHVSDGQLLPFGEVECDHLRRLLQRVLGTNATQQHEQIYGTAIGLVMAHEAYHMLARSTTHTRSGVSKEAVSAHDLLDGRLILPATAQEAIRKALEIHPH
jgi:hypothetical protein